MFSYARDCSVTNDLHYDQRKYRLAESHHGHMPTEFDHLWQTIHNPILSPWASFVIYVCLLEV